MSLSSKVTINVVHARKFLGITQVDMSKLRGGWRQSYLDREHGRVAFTLQDLEMFSKALKIPLAWFLIEDTTEAFHLLRQMFDRMNRPINDDKLAELIADNITPHLTRMK